MLYFICFRKGRLSVDWKRIKAEYIADGISLRKLSEKYGVSFSTIQKKSMEEKWGNLRKKSRTKVEEKIIESVSNKKAKNAVDIIDVADKLLGKISEMLDMEVYNPQNIKSLTSALKDLKEIKGFKSEADKLEQTARIAKLQREAAGEINTDIKVTLEGDLEEYGK
jgi:lambda repressor-like predicted transcriptional regulator